MTGRFDIVFGCLKFLGNIFQDAIFPAKCSACRAFIARENKFRFGSDGRRSSDRAAPSFFCRACEADMVQITPPLCIRCGILFKSRFGENRLCGKCMERNRRFDTARAFGVYQGALMTGIHRYKYQGVTGLAKPFAGMLKRAYLRWWDADAHDLFIPVPLHSSRQRQRGFNQSALMLREWRRMTPFSFDPSVNKKVDRSSIVRNRPTPPQTGLGRSQRIANLTGAFTIKNPHRLRDRSVLLVDDVLTTGATAEACASVLKASGAARVDILTLARAL